MATKYQQVTETLRLPSYVAAIGVFAIMLWDGVNDTFLRLLGVLAAFIGSETVQYVVAGLLLLLAAGSGAYGVLGLLKRIDRLEQKALTAENIPHLVEAIQDTMWKPLKGGQSEIQGMVQGLIVIQTVVVLLVRRTVPEFPKHFSGLLDEAEKAEGASGDPEQRAAKHGVLLAFRGMVGNQ